LVHTVKMFRSILLAALYATQANAQLAAPTAVPSSALVPVNDFSLVLTFSEVVQKATNSVTMTVGDAANVAADANKVSVSCNPPTAKWFNKVVLVPITRSGGLKAGTTMTASIPSNCFKAYRSATPTVNTYSNTATTFTFTTEGSGSCTISGSGVPSNPTTGVPTLYSSATPGIPYAPVNGAWITATAASTKFDLYFSESLVAGTGMVRVTESTVSDKMQTTSGVALESFVPSASRVVFDGEGMKGRVQINKGTNWFTYGAYGLSLDAAAFVDKSGNPTTAYFSSTYFVRVSTTMVPALNFPFNGCCGSSTTTNFTVNHKMVLNFANPVQPAAVGGSPSNLLKLCTGWSPSSACTAGPTVASAAMYFLGKKVIVNPTLTAGQTYNVSIPGGVTSPSVTNGVFLYYSGMSADPNKKWAYTFSVDASTVVDTAPPVLVGGYVDCDGDGNLGNGELCGTWYDVWSTLSADGSTVLPVASNFKLYFRETVAFKASAKATLTADDGTAAVDVLTATHATTPPLGMSGTDCVVTVNPTLKTGKKYTLNIAAGMITDIAAFKNPYEGTSFTFYTQLAAPTVFPTGSGVQRRR